MTEMTGKEDERGPLYAIPPPRPKRRRNFGARPPVQSRMPNRPQPPHVAIAGLVALLSTGCDLHAGLVTAYGSFDRTLTVTGPVELTIRNGAGDIRVLPGADGRVHVVGRIRAHESFVAGLTADERVKRLEANPPVEQGADGAIRLGDIADEALRNNVAIDYDVTVPAHTSVRSATGSGDQILGAVDGPVDVSAGSGDLVIGPVATSVTARTGSGDIEIQGAGRDVVARAASGDVSVTGIAGALRAQTASGDIDVDGRPNADWSVTAASGDVTIRLPQDAAFTLDATSHSGGIRVNHALDASARASRREAHGTARGGGAVVQISTASGTIRID